MKQSLQLKVGQQLTMTPQLQQAIRLLQLSTLDLQQEIQSALDSNPLLEVDEDGPDNSDAAAERHGENNAENNTISETETAKAKTESEATSPDSDSEWAERSDIPEDLPVDSQWDDVFPKQWPRYWQRPRRRW